MKLFYWLANLFERFSSGRDTLELAQWLGMTRDELFEIVPKYHEFSIAKKSGRRRTIHAPDRQLKATQRRILRRLLRGLKSHPAAVGFEQGKSIVTGARQHTGKQIVFRFDIVDFFPSTRQATVLKYFRRIGWSGRAAKLLTRLVTHEGHLPQGAPTSPRLSNLVNFLMDYLLDNFAKSHNGRYTRYADDITLSFFDPDLDLEEIIDGVFRIIRRSGYRPHLGKKLNVRRRGQRQSVNGLVVNEKVNLSREKRRWLRSVKHRAKASWNWIDPDHPDKQRPTLQPRPTVSKSEFEGWLALESMIRTQREQIDE